MSLVRVLSPSAMHSALEAIADAHVKQSGDEVALTFETAPALRKRLDDGEIADVVIAPPRVMEELVAAKKVDAQSRFDLGRAGIGVVVREGAPVPDISSTETLERAMLDAESIVHTRASSGLYVASMIERLGLAGQIAAKITTYHDAVGAFTHLQNGTGREFGFGGMPEIVRWRDRGLRLVGPLPPDIQNYTTYVAALAFDMPNADGARRLMDFLRSAAAKALCVANGVQ